MTNKEYVARQFNRALQLFAQTVSDEATILELADVYPSWQSLVEKQALCKAGTICKYGLNADGETQLYSFVSDYAPVAHYTPEDDPAHYKKIGFSEGGYPVWTQPYGATDAYKIGDIVWHNDALWKCIGGDAGGNNAYEPGVYGWEVYEA